MRRDDLIPIRHALDGARKAMDFVEAVDLETFLVDEIRSLAVVRLLEIVGEAANSVSEELRSKYPAVPWRQMIAMRNRLIHGYFDVDLCIVRDTVLEDLPPLVDALEELLRVEL